MLADKRHCPDSTIVPTASPAKLVAGSTTEQATTATTDIASFVCVQRQSGFALIIEPHGDQDGRLTDNTLFSLLNILLDSNESLAGDDVIVDVSHLRSIDARLLNVLAAAKDRFNGQQRQIVLYAYNSEHRSILSAIRLPCFPTMGRAVSYLLFGV